jgi:hypothetical protein
MSPDMKKEIKINKGVSGSINVKPSKKTESSNIAGITIVAFGLFRNACNITFISSRKPTTPNSPIICGQYVSNKVPDSPIFSLAELLPPIFEMPYSV